MPEEPKNKQEQEEVQIEDPSEKNICDGCQ